MKSASDIGQTAGWRILAVGRTGSGKTTQIWSLPGKKFAYIFDPNSIRSLRGCPDLDYEEFYPDFLELDATLKGFNKGARSDSPGSKREPTVYNRWIEDLNERVDKGDIASYDWLIIDSLTFLTASVMARQAFINNRYGAIEELGDFRVVGNKLSSVFNSVVSLPINLYCTGHLQTYQDDKTAKIETQIKLPGSARDMLPLLFTEVLQCRFLEGKEGDSQYQVRTKPDPRGLEDIRTSIQGLDTYEDVTIKDFNNPTKYGIGSLLTRSTR